MYIIDSFIQIFFDLDTIVNILIFIAILVFLKMFSKP